MVKMSFFETFPKLYKMFPEMKITEEDLFLDDKKPEEFINKNLKIILPENLSVIEVFKSFRFKSNLILSNYQCLKEISFKFIEKSNPKLNSKFFFFLNFQLKKQIKKLNLKIFH